MGAENPIRMLSWLAVTASGQVRASGNRSDARVGVQVVALV